MKLALLIIFTLSIGFIFLYSLVQLSLIVSYFKAKKHPESSPKPWKEDLLPKVTIQLPLYNEFYVAERLLDTVSELDYPKDKLEIQILDDSDDETIDIVSRKVHEYQLKGYDICHIRRDERSGYKAGALAYGTKLAKGEYIAIFDADFLPDPQFIRKTIPYFQNEKIGVVQTKWTYINGDYSFLTKVQEFGLNAHFTVEQVGRNHHDHFINFNGTAGIWRKKCILDAGGWQPDTLTEDLDLSYRAQLKGWKFKYLENLESPSELPVEINSLRAQQFRWTKGAAECVRKDLMPVLRSKKTSIGTKIHALFHLSNSTVFFFVLLLSILTLPVITFKPEPEYTRIFQIASFFMISWFILAAFYWVAYSYGKPQKLKLLVGFLWKFPLFLAISMGLAFHNTLAVIEGYIGRKSPFIRTPKFNIHDRADRWDNSKYAVKKVGPMTYIEGLFFIYFVCTLETAVLYQNYGIIPLCVLLVTGYGIVFFSSIFHWKRSAKQLKYEEVF